MFEKIIILVMLVGASAAIVYSIVTTVRLFQGFTADNSETNDERISRLKKYRKKVIISYAAAVILITAAAMVKIF